MRQNLLIPALLAALALSPAPARAASGAGVELEICRLPGSLTGATEKAIEVPAGMSFVTDQDNSVLSPGLNAPRALPPIRVVTTAPVSLGPGSFCVRAPIKPLAAGAVSDALGRMFIATGTDPAGPGGLKFDQIYGVLQQSVD
jgi:hypothetical protein